MTKAETFWELQQWEPFKHFESLGAQISISNSTSFTVLWLENLSFCTHSDFLVSQGATLMMKKASRRGSFVQYYRLKRFCITASRDIQPHMRYETQWAKQMRPVKCPILDAYLYLEKLSILECFLGLKWQQQYDAFGKNGTYVQDILESGGPFHIIDIGTAKSAWIKFGSKLLVYKIVLKSEQFWKHLRSGTGKYWFLNGSCGFSDFSVTLFLAIKREFLNCHSKTCWKSFAHVKISCLWNWNKFGIIFVLYWQKNQALT